MLQIEKGPGKIFTLCELLSAAQKAFLENRMDILKSSLIFGKKKFSEIKKYQKNVMENFL